MPTAWPQPWPLNTSVPAETVAGVVLARVPAAEVPAAQQSAPADRASVAVTATATARRSIAATVAEVPGGFRRSLQNRYATRFSAPLPRLACPHGRAYWHAAPSPLPLARARGGRWHGRDLPGDRRSARARRRRQDPRRALRPGSGDPRSLHARGARGRAPLRGAAHGDDLRRRRARAAAVHRHGVPPRRLTRRPAAARASIHGRGARLAGRSGGRPPPGRPGAGGATAH